MASNAMQRTVRLSTPLVEEGLVAVAANAPHLVQDTAAIVFNGQSTVPAAAALTHAASSSPAAEPSKPKAPQQPKPFIPALPTPSERSFTPVTANTNVVSSCAGSSSSSSFSSSSSSSSAANGASSAGSGHPAGGADAPPPPGGGSGAPPPPPGGGRPPRRPPGGPGGPAVDAAAAPGDPAAPAGLAPPVAGAAGGPAAGDAPLGAVPPPPPGGAVAIHVDPNAGFTPEEIREAIKNGEPLGNFSVPQLRALNQHLDQVMAGIKQDQARNDEQWSKHMNNLRVNLVETTKGWVAVGVAGLGGLAVYELGVAPALSLAFGVTGVGCVVVFCVGVWGLMQLYDAGFGWPSVYAGGGLAKSKIVSWSLQSQETALQAEAHAVKSEVIRALELEAQRIRRVEAENERLRQQGDANARNIALLIQLLPDHQRRRMEELQAFRMQEGPHAEHEAAHL